MQEIFMRKFYLELKWRHEVSIYSSEGMTSKMLKIIIFLSKFSKTNDMRDNLHQRLIN